MFGGFGGVAPDGQDREVKQSIAVTERGTCAVADDLAAEALEIERGRWRTHSRRVLDDRGDRIVGELGEIVRLPVVVLTARI